MHKKLLLICLMSGALLSVQLAQADYLHNHTEHSSECVLWHFHLGDDSEVDHCAEVSIDTRRGSFSAVIARFYSEAPVSPYLSRAPPAIPHHQA